MSVRAKVDRLYHKLKPSGLMQERITFLREADAICQRLDPHHVPLSEQELLLAARDAARTGNKPGDVLAKTLIAAVRDANGGQRCALTR